MPEPLRDPALEALFRAASPAFADGDRFMSRLNARLDAMELLARREKAWRLRCRSAVVLAVVLAVGFGIALVAYLMSVPPGAMSLAFGAWCSHLHPFALDARLLAPLLLSVAACLVTLSLVRLVLDAPIGFRELRRA